MIPIKYFINMIRIISTYRADRTMWDKRTDMWCVYFVLLAVVTCNAEQFSLSAVEFSSAPENRIIGGSPTTIQRYPYTVQVLFRNQFLCGGTLVTRLHVLSAAHCFVNQFGLALNPSLFTIRVGTDYLNTGGTVHEVLAYRLHDSYNVPVRDNDVAVVLLSAPVNVSATVDIAYIPLQGASLNDNSTVTVVGWGRTQVNSTASSWILNHVDVRKINLAVCASRYLMLQTASGVPYPITTNMICAGILDVGGKDACQGDSGGPLIYNGVVVGITSWGNGCALAEYPGVYARVSSYTSWINATVNYETGWQVAYTTATTPSTATTALPTINSTVTFPTFPATTPQENTGHSNSNIGTLSLLIPLLYLILSA